METALQQLASALHNKDNYATLHENLSSAFYAEYQVHREGEEYGSDSVIIRNVADRAASRFLQRMCSPAC